MKSVRCAPQQRAGAELVAAVILRQISDVSHKC